MNRSTHVRWMLPLIALLIVSGLPAAHAAGLPAAPQDVPGNVVPDGGFEQQGQGWESCGGVTFADAQANQPDAALHVHSGRYAARIGNPTIEQGEEACPLEGTFPPSQLLRVPISIPADASELTVSFWYSRVGQETIGDVNIFFSDRSDFLVETDYSMGARLNDVSNSENIGWYEFRQVLRGEDLANARRTYADADAGRPPSGNTYLNIRLVGPSTDEAAASVYIDDLAVTFSDRSIQPAPLPAALASDGTQPIMYMHAIPDEQGFGVYRMDTDGSKAQLIYRSRLVNVRLPRWSPDGQRLVAIETDLKGFNPDDLTVNPAQADELTILDANGRPLAAPARGFGVPGVKGDPPGCEVRPEQPFCRRSEERAIDARIFSADWSPQSNALVIEFATRSRSSTGAQTDDRASLLRIDGQTPFDILAYDNDAYKINTGGASPSWGANNRILFYDSFGGIYQDTPEINLDNAELLLPFSGKIFSIRGMNFPTWSRDASQFVTVNGVAGGDRFAGNTALVLHDPTDSTRTHALVTMDYPRYIDGHPAWSPDGRYILFTVVSPTENGGEITDIWWVAVATGLAGQLTNDGVSLQADWRPTAGSRVPAGLAPGGGPGVQVAQGFPASSPSPTPGAFRAFLPLMRQR